MEDLKIFCSLRIYTRVKARRWERKVRHYISRHVSAAFLSLVLCFLLQGCSRTQPYSETGFYLNTSVTLTVYRQKDVPLIQECFYLCNFYENMLSRTLEGSDVYRINHSDGAPVLVSQETALLLERAVFYAELSGGRIDPTIAPLMELWDFTGQASEEEAESSSNGQRNRIPDESDILSRLSHIDYETVHIDGCTVTLTDPEAQIDLGFIAKGYIADRLKEYLLANGVSSAIISLGGNVLTVGSKPDGSPFQVGIQKPFGARGETLAVLPVSDSSLVSSGVYERYFEQDGKRYHHLLDPDTGYPVENGLLGVTILSSSSMEGDALSTTCFCLGLEEGMDLVESLPGTEAIFITQDNALHPSSGLSLP